MLSEPLQSSYSMCVRTLLQFGRVLLFDMWSKFLSVYSTFGEKLLRKFEECRNIDLRG